MRFFHDLIFYIKNNYFWFLIVLLLIVINDAFILSDLYSIKTSSDNAIYLNDFNKEENNIKSDKFKVDIKGYVKKPGVYEVTDDMNVNDLINLAGGLKKNATTKNINLSKKLFDQMVVVISNKTTFNKTNNQIINTLDNVSSIKNDAVIENNLIEGEVKEEENNISSNNLININTASIDELLTLSGIGKSKADAIIEYRKENKFNKIEDIMNVSGIGESMFEKIKDSITV